MKYRDDVMARICMVLTITPWHDRRQFHRQAPALIAGGHEVIYMAGDPGKERESSFTWSVISGMQRRLARPLGGLNLLPRILALKPDVVQLCSVELLPLGLSIKRRSDIRVVYDCREDMVSAMLHKDRWPMPVRRLMAWFTQRMENRSDRLFDGLVTADPSVCDMHSDMPDDRKIIFFNGPQLSLFTNDYPPLHERRYDVVMMGSMTRRSGILPLMKAVAKMKQSGREVSVMLLGQPDEYVIDGIKSIIRENKLDNDVLITGRMPHKEVPHTLQQARIGVVPLLDMPKFRRNIACKAFEYMACGMPVVSSDLPPERIFLRHEDNALFFESGNIDQMAKAIVRLLDDPDLASRMGQVGRMDIERQWNAEIFQQQYCEFFNTILQKPLRAV